MTNKEFYQETFSQVTSSYEIRWEELQRKSRRKPMGKRLLVPAAVVCLLAVFSTVAVANSWFGLRDLELKEDVTVTEPDGTESMVTLPTGSISLQGYSETPEKMAMEEWKEFLNHYDADGEILSSIGNSPTGLEEEYLFYLVYTQEMADKLEEILAKYDLKKHTNMLDIYPKEELCAQVGGDFLGENRAYSTYLYEDGTFKFDGQTDLPEYGLLDYQFMRCVRGSFTDIMLNVGDVASYREWTYSTACGIPVTLALGSSKALVIADLPDCFVTINVLAGTETSEYDIFSSGPFMAQDLERFADSFDFSLLTPVRPANPELYRPTLEEVLNIPSPEDFLRMTGVEETEAQQFYAEFLNDVENDERAEVLERILYPVTVTVPEGVFTAESAEEVLPYYEEIFTEGLWEQIMINQYTKERSDLFATDGLIGAAGGSIWMAALEDGMAVMTIQNPEGGSLRPTGGIGISEG